MISNTKLAASLVLIFFCLSTSVSAQSAAAELKHFSADRISFDYPAEYSLTDESTPDEQRLTITRKGSSLQLRVVVLRRTVLKSESSTAIESFKEPIIKQLAMSVGPGKNLPARTALHTQIGPMEAEGVRLRSPDSRKTGDVFWLRMKFRLIGLTLVRSDKDESAGSQLWEALRTSFKVEAPVIAGMKAQEATPGNAITGGVLNGKALSLPQPPYPPIARAAHVSGTVTVQVLIDEEGNVSDAHAIDGHPLLQAACVAAARAAKFSPTLLEGEPVKVTGVIKYNFVAQ